MPSSLLHAVDEFWSLVRKGANRMLSVQIKPEYRLSLEHCEDVCASRPFVSTNISHLDLQWIIPDFQKGAGGHTTIFRIVHFLEQFGHRNRLWIMGGSSLGSAQRVREVIRDSFFPLEAEVGFIRSRSDAEKIEGDAVIATNCWSAYPARSVRNVAAKFYFVQDFEPSFYPVGSESLLAELTYRFGFTCITAGKWLKNVMSEDYGLKAYSFDLAVDHRHYFVDDSTERTSSRIALYARYPTPRRAVELGILALEVAAIECPDLVVDFFGYRIGRRMPFQSQEHGVLSPRELGQLYRRAALGMALSATNYSLVPNEMMASGCPVVDLRVPSVQAIYADEEIFFADPDPARLASVIVSALKSKEKRLAKAAQGLRVAQRLSWEESARSVENALQIELMTKVK